MLYRTITVLGYSRWLHESTDLSQVPSAKIQKGSCYLAQPRARECPSQPYNRHGVLTTSVT